MGVAAAGAASQGPFEGFRGHVAAGMSHYQQTQEHQSSVGQVLQQLPATEAKSGWEPVKTRGSDYHVAMLRSSRTAPTGQRTKPTGMSVGHNGQMTQSAGRRTRA